MSKMGELQTPARETAVTAKLSKIKMWAVNESSDVASPEALQTVQECDLLLVVEIPYYRAT